MTEKNFLYISKLDAAKRQLELAIRLFLSYSDVVCIHTLTAAAHEVLWNLCKKQDKKSFIKDDYKTFIKPEYLKVWEQKMSEAENFFKHADKDPDKLLKFRPEPTEWFIWDACSMYQNLTGEHTPLIILYRMWFFAKNPDILADNNIKSSVITAAKELGLDFNNRQRFLEQLPAITKL